MAPYFLRLFIFCVAGLHHSLVNELRTSGLIPFPLNRATDYPIQQVALSSFRNSKLGSADSPDAKTQN
nr:MAG: hypothetical protein EDM05_03230 [Leptolyngbya sp. IPPAS B-1204]